MAPAKKAPKFISKPKTPKAYQYSDYVKLKDHPLLKPKGEKMDLPPYKGNPIKFFDTVPAKATPKKEMPLAPAPKGRKFKNEQ